jgi:type VI secretion system FHA domain protein
MSSSWAPPEAAAGQWGPVTGGQATSPASPASGGWSAPPHSSSPAAAQQAPSAWDPGPGPAAVPASSWSSPQTAPAAPSAEDVWGKFSESNVVDWARGGFGQPSAPSFPAAAPSAPSTAPPVPPSAASGNPSFGTQSPPPAGQIATPNPAQTAAPVREFANAIGLTPDRLALGDGDTLRMAGTLLRRLVAGMVVMLEARARAKSQLGAQGTSLEFDGNNPLKFARTPEQALAQLLNAPERGFMGSEQAIEDAFKDLQAHQMATLSAMQGALRATLDRFSPRAIRARAEGGGLLSKILPGAKEAALWAAYEREFSGVAQGSDEAFMDVFASEFKRAYDEMAKRR